MDTFNQKLSSQWKDTSNLVLGLWLAVLPWAPDQAALADILAMGVTPEELAKAQA
jgi:hypothetical protein